MDGSRFDVITRSLSQFTSRRTLITGALVAAAPWLDGATVGAKPKRRKKRKKLKPVKPNQYGCLEVNDPCRRSTQCCSGICSGKPGRKRCRAHGTGACRQDLPGACKTTFDEIPLHICDARCACYRTTAGSNFCSEGVYSDQRNCTTCKRDADCLALGFPPGSACAPVAPPGLCSGFCDTDMACLAPCGIELPEPPTM